MVETTTAIAAPLDARALSRLRWRCRRGMLENDLILERFWRNHGATLTARHALCLAELMELGDNDLLDLHLGRKQLPNIDEKLDREEVREVLRMLRENR
jgi:antitoxin CptB